VQEGRRLWVGGGGLALQGAVETGWKGQGVVLKAEVERAGVEEVEVGGGEGGKGAEFFPQTLRGIGPGAAQGAPPLRG